MVKSCAWSSIFIYITHIYIFIASSHNCSSGDICNNIEEGRLSGVLFLDLKKAFDTIDHNIAISKLSKLNMSPNVLNWYHSYLENRYQVTRVNGIDSVLRELTCGVPQGSILGPLIFILYLNDLLHSLNVSNIACTGTSHQSIADEMHEELASRWFNEHKILLNLAKTKVISHKLREVAGQDFEYNNISIEVVDRFKYLGIMLDKHVSHLYSKIYPKLKLLGKIRCNIGQATSIYLYNCLLNPLFAFIDYMYNVINSSDAKKLQVFQNNCIRTCLRCEKLTPRLYSRSGIKPLNEQRAEHTCSIVSRD